MELNKLVISLRRPPFLISKSFKPCLSLSTSSNSNPSADRVPLAHSLQAEALKTLEWSSVCKQLSAFTSTPMGFSVAHKAQLPFGQTQKESQRLLDQTSAARMVAEPLDFSEIEDLKEIVDIVASGELLTIRELCSVRRTLRAARELHDKLDGLSMSGDHCPQRYIPLLEVLNNCEFQIGLEHKIEFCVDCNLSIILDRASEELEIIRSERKSNMEVLTSLLKEVSSWIFQAEGINKPVITKRRSRMCVGVRATHKHLLQDGVVLDVSSSGATYFMEPKEAVELNNMEVRLSDSEKAEERAILSLLAAEVAESGRDIKYLLDKIIEVDLAFARGAYSEWINGICPIFSSVDFEISNSSREVNALAVDIDGIKHPLLLESSLESLPAVHTSRSASQSGYRRDLMALKTSSEYEQPVPIDFKIGHGTRVVVISGPNTGGKTASMKTLGLASLMAKAGMHLPAKSHPKLPWFDLILADIGDHQSLEQNLSTFSGHISRISKILEVASEKSLVVIDEIGSGTDPSEGVALSTSILHYLKDHVGLSVVTTHYVDLTNLKENDDQFEKAAMEFSLDTLRPTYQILWGCTGDSNALTIAKSIGFDESIIERAQSWAERLMPDKQQEQRGLLYHSLLEERNRLQAQARRAASVHEEIMNLYHEIQVEAGDLDERKSALMSKETRIIKEELLAAKCQMETVVQEFEQLLRTGSANELNSLIRKSESAIASIVKAHCPGDDLPVSEACKSSYIPQFGEQVLVKVLGNKFATVVEEPGDDETILVQLGKVKMRVRRSNIKPIPNNKSNAATSSSSRLQKQGQRNERVQDYMKTNENEISYSPVVQTSKNTVDLRGMRVEEASYHLEMAINARDSYSVLFVIHGMGTGAVKERALEMLDKHPRVTNYEPESPMNYGCTIAYIK